MRRVFPLWGHDDLLPALEAVKNDFRNKFDRDMTPDEVRLYTLTKDILEHPGDRALIYRQQLHIDAEEDRSPDEVVAAERKVG